MSGVVVAEELLAVVNELELKCGLYRNEAAQVSESFKQIIDRNREEAIVNMLKYCGRFVKGSWKIVRVCMLNTRKHVLSTRDV